MRTRILVRPLRAEGPAGHLQRSYRYKKEKAMLAVLHRKAAKVNERLKGFENGPAPPAMVPGPCLSSPPSVTIPAGGR